MASPTPQYESVRIEEVKDKSELLELVHLSVLGLKDDGFTYWIEKYGNTSMFEDTMSKMTTAVDDPNSYIFKAILSTEDESGKRSERLVGLSQWYLGYAEVPKVDPFAGKTVSDESTVPEIVTEIVSSDVKIEGDGKIQAKEDKTQSKSDVLEDMMRRKGNAYIGTIRGKKHVYLRRLVVHPNYQRRGIGEKLMQWGIDTADELGIVSWLMARPAGMRLYEKTGFAEVATIPFNVPDLDIPPAIAMLRKPNLSNRR